MTGQFLPSYLDNHHIHEYGDFNVSWFVGSSFVDSKQHQITYAKYFHHTYQCHTAVIPDHFNRDQRKFQNLNGYDSLISAERSSESDAFINHLNQSRLLYLEMFSDLSSHTCAQIHCESNITNVAPRASVIVYSYLQFSSSGHTCVSDQTPPCA